MNDLSSGKTDDTSLEAEISKVVEQLPVTMPAATKLPSPVPEHIQQKIAEAIEDSKKCRAALLEAVDGLETYVRGIRKRVQDNIGDMDSAVDDSATALGRALTKLQQYGDSMSSTWDIIWPQHGEEPTS